MAVKKKSWLRGLAPYLVVLALLVALVAYIGYDRFLREVPQPAFMTEAERFKYGSMGSENDRGIPYLIWQVLPRIFPEYLPGPGGYRAFGIPWEPGQELPVGFAKKRVGFDRITNNCAICHMATYRMSPDGERHFVAAGPGHTNNLQKVLRFLTACARDPRFNADVILSEIDLVTKLSPLDRQLYRFLIIPFTRKAILEQDRQFAWMNRPHWPDWGPGRDDPMNLTKYFMTEMPYDESVGSADFPSIWNLKIRDGEGKTLNWGGETPAARSVVIDSALGLGMPPTSEWVARMDKLTDWLKALAPPKFPGADASRAANGREIYMKHCADCHEPGGKRTSTVIDIAEIGTDDERLKTWTQEAADKANSKVKSMGVERVGLVKTNGYVSPPLDGIWLRAPYLHNGAVANLRDLLEPPAKRKPVFYRGYDVYDSANMGFISEGPEAERVGFRLDTKVRGNGNGGHDYGTSLTPDEKELLLEYMKTL